VAYLCGHRLHGAQQDSDSGPPVLHATRNTAHTNWVTDATPDGVALQRDLDNATRATSTDLVVHDTASHHGVHTKPCAAVCLGLSVCIHDLRWGHAKLGDSASKNVAGSFRVRVANHLTRREKGEAGTGGDGDVSQGGGGGRGLGCGNGDAGTREGDGGGQETHEGVLPEQRERT
jgi:hypothetical protein